MHKISEKMAEKSGTWNYEFILEGTWGAVKKNDEIVVLGGYKHMGGGFCRSAINPNKYLNSIVKDSTTDAQCKSKCDSSTFCTG